MAKKIDELLKPLKTIKDKVKELHAEAPKTPLSQQVYEMNRNPKMGRDPVSTKPTDKTPLSAYDQMRREKMEAHKKRLEGTELDGIHLNEWSTELEGADEPKVDEPAAEEASTSHLTLAVPNKIEMKPVAEVIDASSRFRRK